MDTGDDIAASVVLVVLGTRGRNVLVEFGGGIRTFIQGRLPVRARVGNYGELLSKFLSPYVEGKLCPIALSLHQTTRSYYTLDQD